jgi:hypothetical protein
MQEEDEGCAGIIWSISEGWKCWFGRQECCMNSLINGGGAVGVREGVASSFSQIFTANFA